ncbi:GNAT family N-acetyltransferase [Candidatus Micrarchaeota archaeon]|nr:GNAT family N-acetyltransferase [Candidatus Micrarchaeota archaeon]
MRIRNYRQEDSLQTAQCIRRSLSSISSKYYPKKVIWNLKEYYTARNLKTGENEPWRLVAIEGENIVGTISLTKDGWIMGLFVDPRYFARGIGGNLLEKIEKLAKKRGFEKVRAHAAINAVEFYKMHEYKVLRQVSSEEYGKTYRVIKKL